PVGVADPGVDADLVAVFVEARRVAPEDHREAVLRKAHAPQRPQVVVVKRCRLDGDGRPAVRALGLGALPDLEAAQGILAVDRGCVDGEHRRGDRIGFPATKTLQSPAVCYARGAIWSL